MAAVEGVERLFSAQAAAVRAVRGPVYAGLLVVVVVVRLVWQHRYSRWTLYTREAAHLEIGNVWHRCIWQNIVRHIPIQREIVRHDHVWHKIVRHSHVGKHIVRHIHAWDGAIWHEAVLHLHVVGWNGALGHRRRWQAGGATDVERRGHGLRVRWAPGSARRGRRSLEGLLEVDRGLDWEVVVLRGV